MVLLDSSCCCCLQALRAGSWADDGRMQQEALLLRGLSSSSSTKQEILPVAEGSLPRTSTHLNLQAFSLHGQQQDSLMRLMWAHWEVRSNFVF